MLPHLITYIIAKTKWLNVRFCVLFGDVFSCNSSFIYKHSITHPSIIIYQIRRYGSKQCAILLLAFFSLLQVSCGGGGESAPSGVRTVEVSWVANRETAVNSNGGGYKVYYSNRSGFNLFDTDVSEVDVPYASPPLTPTSVRIQLQSGQYYFRVLAYSALNSPWGASSSMSMPSKEIMLIVP